MTNAKTIFSEGITPVRMINTNNVDYQWKDIEDQGSANCTIHIIIDEMEYSVQADENGKWSFKPDTWIEGLHTVTIFSVDPASNASAPTTFLVNCDTTKPAQPEIWRIEDDSSAQNSNLTPGDSTKDTSPVISGVSEPNTIVYLYDNGSTDPIASTITNSMGAWSMKPTLTAGDHALQVGAKDATNNVSDLSAAFDVTVEDGAITKALNHANQTDYIQPLESDAVPLANTNELPKQVYIPSDTITFDAGGADPNGMVEILINEAVFTFQADAAGNWRFESPKLTDGIYQVQVRFGDIAGNWGDAVQRIYYVETALPEAPQIMRVIDNEGDVDYLSFNDYTNDKTPTLSGVAQPGTLVNITSNGKVIGSVTASEDGRWSFEPTLSADGNYVFSASYVDRHGRESAKSDPFTLTLDTRQPDPATLDQVIDDTRGTEVELVSGAVSSDTTPTLKGKADANTLVRVWDGDTIIGSVMANARGEWELTINLEPGDHSLSVDSLTKGGTASEKSASFDLTIDLNIIDKPEISKIVADNGAQEIELASGDATNDSTPKFTGVGKDGDTILIYDNNQLIGSVTVANGQWEFTINPALTDGEHSLTAKTQDKDTGKLSDATDPFTLTIDTQAPDKPDEPTIVADGNELSDPSAPIKDTQPDISGEDADAGDLVSVIIKDKNTGGETIIGTAIVGEDGKWTVTPGTEIPDGEYELVVEIKDPAGNTSESDPVDLIIDTHVPVNPTVIALVDDVGPNTGDITDGSVTDDDKPTLKGTSTETGTIMVYDNGTLINSVTVTAGAEFELELNTLTEGSHAISYRVVSESGVEGELSASIGFEVDTTAPVVGTFDGVYKDLGGTETLLAVDSTTGRIETKDLTPILKGTGQKGDVVVIYGDANKTDILGSTVVDDTGNWRFEYTEYEAQEAAKEQVDVTVIFGVGFRDAAGNETSLNTSFPTHLDTTPPGKPQIPFGAVENIMEMSLNDILALDAKSLFIDNDKAQVIAMNEDNKSLGLEDILPKGENVDDWNQAAGTMTIAGVEYDVYQNTAGTAEVLVEHRLEEI